jgi:HEAT repeat protein
MKTVYKTKVKRTLVALTIVLLAAISTNLFAQGNKIVVKKVNDTALKNLTAAITSENEGLRRSGVYLAGKYKIAEVVDELTEILSEEKDPNNRVLIVLALNEIGTDKALKAIKKLAVNDEDIYVRRMSYAIFKK